MDMYFQETYNIKNPSLSCSRIVGEARIQSPIVYLHVFFQRVPFLNPTKLLLFTY